MDSDNKGTGSEQQSGLHSHAHLVHQQECMVGHCNAWTVSYCTLMDYATVSYWYICMSLTTSGVMITCTGSVRMSASEQGNNSLPRTLPDNLRATNHQTTPMSNTSMSGEG